MLPYIFSLDVFCDCYQTPVLLSCKPSGRDPTPHDAVAVTGCEGRASLRLQRCSGAQRQAGGMQEQGRRARYLLGKQHQTGRFQNKHDTTEEMGSLTTDF